MRVCKKDGHYEVFSEEKIRKSILSAFMAVGPFNSGIPDPAPISREIVRRLIAEYGNETEWGVDNIADIVEKTLSDAGHFRVARQYILYRVDQASRRATRLKPDNTMISDYVQASKYARRTSGGHREIREETVDRTIAMMIKKFPEWGQEIREMYSGVYDAKLVGSMRCMQFGGDAVETENIRIYNCSFTNINRVRAFSEIFYVLLCGSGVGYSVKWAHVDCLPKVTTVQQGVMDKVPVHHHSIGDTIEGWAVASQTLIDSFLNPDSPCYGKWVEFDYSEIRPEGQPLKTSGGVAPGHMDLRYALEKIREILLNAQGHKLRPIQVHDIVCWLAWCVVSGGIRRASLLCLFDPEDTEMIYCKTKDYFDPSNGINTQRQMANNSGHFVRPAVEVDPQRWYRAFKRLIEVSVSNYGCPGFFFSESADSGCNPCGEIGLHPVWINPEGEPLTGFAFCNLSEINVATCEDEDDFYSRCYDASAIGTLQATFTNFGYLGEVSRRIAERDALLGVSLTGMMDNPELAFDPDVLEQGCKVVKKANEEWAANLGINPARSLTCVKPSGTASLWMGCASGIHPRHSRRFFRRVTAGAEEPQARYFLSINPHAAMKRNDGKISIEFPIQIDNKAISLDELETYDHIDKILTTYSHWVLPGTTRGNLTHNVSCTVCVKNEIHQDAKKFDQLIDYIWTNASTENGRIAAMSFVPESLDTLFEYAPNKAVRSDYDETRWNTLIQLMRPVDWSQYVESENSGLGDTLGTLEAACAGGVCELT